MKRILAKDLRREIKNSKKRFISIMVMAFLGVGFFAGIKATSPDMQNTIDKYYYKHNVYDIEVVSTLGLTVDDIEALKSIKNVEDVYGSYSKDVEIEIGEESLVSKVYSLNKDINTVKLKNGGLPQNYDECIVEESFLEVNKLKIGDYVELKLEGTEEFFKTTKLKIVGTMSSPLYISKDKGTTKLGKGTIDYYMYVSQDNIISDIYTQAYLTVSNVKGLNICSDKYKSYVDSVERNIEDIKEEREQARYNSIVNEANQKLEEAQKELEDRKEEGQNEIKKAEDKLLQAKRDIQNAKVELTNKKKETEIEISQAKTKIEEGKIELANGKLELLKKEKEVNDNIVIIEEKIKEQEDNLELINIAITDLQIQYNSEIDISIRQYLETEINNANLNMEQVKKGINTLESTVNGIKGELEAAKTEIIANEKNLKSAEEEILKNEELANEEFMKAENKIKTGEEEYNKGSTELEKAKKEYNEKILEAEEKILQAREDVSKIKEAKWYILDINKNSGFSGFVQDTQSIANIGKVFPIVFFVIAILISLTTMTRMVEENRGQIGTFKTLGYSGTQIAGKYIIYALLACLIGGVLGMAIGFQLLPRVIWIMYSMLYSIPDFVVEWNMYYGVTGLLAITICIVGATVIAIRKEIIPMPAVLMRPKAPKIGKRVLLEKVKFIWKRLNFIQKVTVRNMFRYKKRLLLTVIGIFGCTSLIVAGFGIKDSISRILADQYGEIFNYDMLVTLKGDLTLEGKNNFKHELEDKEQVNEVVEAYMNSLTINGNKEDSQDIQIIVPENNESLLNAINLNEVKTGNKISLNDETVVITDKLAQLLDVKVGDKVTLKNDDKEITVTVGNVTKNYVYHYVYMTKELYQALSNDYEINTFFLNNIELSETQEDELMQEIISSEKTSNISKISYIQGLMDDMMSSLNYVVIVLIVSSGLLAFVVLYNLANVNISERIRELATIKVLGFYDREVYQYLNRETVILTIFGVILGLIGGYFLNYFIIGTCEINILRFNKTVFPISYIYSAVITFTFTAIVNIFTYKALKKIDMIESLKSVE